MDLEKDMLDCIDSDIQRSDVTRAEERDRDEDTRNDPVVDLYNALTQDTSQQTQEPSQNSQDPEATFPPMTQVDPDEFSEELANEERSSEGKVVNDDEECDESSEDLANKERSSDSDSEEETQAEMLSNRAIEKHPKKIVQPTGQSHPITPILKNKSRKKKVTFASDITDANAKGVVDSSDHKKGAPEPVPPSTVSPLTPT